MKTLRFIFASAVLLLATPVAHAQLFRAYLSVNGNDNNPCTLPAPCRLLPAALLAVADGGEVWMLDSANFNTGTVTLGKSVSIVAVPGALGSLVANGADALQIAGSGTRVSLRNLFFTRLAGSPNLGNGVVASAAGGRVSVEGCTFSGLADAGFIAGGGAFVRVRGSVFRGNGSQGLYARDLATVTVTDSSFVANGLQGILASIEQAGTVKVSVSVTGSVISGNNTGVSASSDLAGGDVSVWLQDNTIANNVVGVAATRGGKATLVRNTIVGTTTTALTVNAAAGNLAIVSGNTIADNGRAFQVGALGILENAGDNLIRDNAQADTGVITPITLQ